MSGIFACSTAAIMIKAGQTHVWLVAAYRLLGASLILAPFYFYQLRQHGLGQLRHAVGRSIPAGFLLALHFWTWNEGVRRTLAANATLIANMTPMVMPILVWILVRERMSRREAIGTGLGFAGLLILGASDGHLNFGHFIGDLICFFSMVAFAGYLAWNRRCLDIPSLWLYLVPVYVLAGLISLAFGTWATGGQIGVGNFQEGALLVGLAVIPTVIGHSTLNHAMQTMPSQTVSILNLFQFVFAGILGWWFFGEKPGIGFFAASGLTVAGAWVVLGTPRRGKEGDEPEKL
jgi:drug/metabolite transporter (DMT)-like permease